MAYVLCSKCQRQIPAALRCRGSVVRDHEGLYFQAVRSWLYSLWLLLTLYKCENCGFLRWVPPPSRDPYGINPGQPFGTNDPFPRNENILSPPPPPPPEIDPLLYVPPDLPYEFLSPTPRAPPAPASTADVSKPLCSQRNCKRIAAAKGCTNDMCKTCCQLSTTPCAYAAHRNSTPVVAANGNPSALARPPAIVQSFPSASASASASTSALPIDGRKGVEERKEAEDRKRSELRRVQNEVAVCFYGEPPERLRDQDVTSFPFFNLARSATLLRKMKLSVEDDYGLYDFAAGLWNREDVNTTLQITSGQTLLIRRVGVTRCPDIDKMIALYAPVHKSAKAGTSMLKRKPDRERDPSNRIVQARRATHTGERKRRSSSHRRPSLPSSPPPSSPLRRSSSAQPSPSSSPFPSPSRLLSLVKAGSRDVRDTIDLTLSPSPSPPGRPRRALSVELVIKSEAVASNPLIPITATNVRDSTGRVMVLPGFGSWPAGVYAQDMAWAFGKITRGRGAESNVETRFNEVFPGTEFKKPTYDRQLSFWRKSTQQERDAMARVPRNSGGLWTAQRKSLSGYQDFTQKKNKD
ncbi:hypothetical protein B0H16DRAFT_1815076 [Mycena metata]|uniref:Uncharacterized protein n=1 Tax=Mycena metata TaxID=1033252 RepID=A0AAD7NGF3_9AGAR|nr:hypothetical protein B0H16DRAFT_1815076 [Mycena metata]